MGSPFFGREAELATLAALIRRGRVERRPVTSLIVGDPGSGKSRLLQEAGRSWERERHAICSGFEATVPVPLAAAGSLLRALSEHGEDGAILARLTFGGESEDAALPLRVFEAAYRSLAAGGHFIVVIDDLQWVDEPSLALVHYLVRSARQGRVGLAVIAAGRPSPAVERFRAASEADLDAADRSVVELGPLSRESGVDLALALDAALGVTAADRLWQRAGGSPFWVEVLARSHDGADIGGLIDQRLRSLSIDAGWLLAALAVGARPVTAVELSGRLGWPDARTAAAAQELLGRGLATTVAGTIRTTHDLIREAVTTSLPDPVRRELHARIADEIEGIAGVDLGHLREALMHRTASGGDPMSLALRMVRTPGRRMLAAADLARLAAISDARPVGDPGRRTLDRAVAELAAIVGDQELALERWSRASETAADSFERQYAETEAARAAYVLRRSDEAHRRLDRARDAARPPPAAAIRIDALLADVQLWLDHETALGGKTAARALAAAEKMANEAGGIGGLSTEARRAYLAALLAAGDAALQDDRAEDVLALSEGVVRVTEGLDDESRIAGQVRVGFALGPLGRVREAEAHYRLAWDASRRLVLPMLTIEAGHGMARMLRMLGRFAEAHDVAREAREIEIRVRNAPRRWGNASSTVHGIELYVGDPAAALRALRSDAANEPDPHYRIGIHEISAVWQARFVGAPAAADVLKELNAASASSALAACPRCASELSIVTAESLARIGHVTAAHEEFAAWDRRPARSYHQRSLWRLRATAAIAAAEGDLDAALAHLDTYAAELERAGLLEDLLWAQIDRGRLLSRLDRAAATAAYTEAANLAGRVGAVGHGRLAARALRQLGVRAWRRSPASVAPSVDRLSPREREIAAMIAGGASNREVADALLISPKTVERHVTNIFAKVGVRNRTELGAAMRVGVVRDSPDE